MIRFTWRQFRLQAAVGVGALAVIAIVLATTGIHLAHLYDTTVANCAKNDDCPAAQSALLTTYALFQNGLPALVIVAPALIGIFWGAPLIARELENGTFRLAWTQSVARTRWLIVKLGVVGVSSMATAGLLAFMVTWWSSPINKINQNRFSQAMFGVLGITPIGYAAFAFAFGVTAGLLMRRTLPAMATTLVAFIVARLVVMNELRARFMAPLTLRIPLNPNNGIGISKSPGGITISAPSPALPNAWVYSSNVVNNAGQGPSTQAIQKACPNLPIFGPLPSPAAGGVTHVGVRAGGPGQLQGCIAKLAEHYHVLVMYQPASRFWAFQWFETGTFIAAALALSALCWCWIGKRTT